MSRQNEKQSNNLTFPGPDFNCGVIRFEVDDNHTTKGTKEMREHQQTTNATCSKDSINTLWKLRTRFCPF